MSSIFKFWASTTSVTLGLVIVFQVAISCGEWFDIFLVKKGMTSASSFVCTERNIRSQLVRGALQHEYIITRCCYRNNDVAVGNAISTMQKYNILLFIQTCLWSTVLHYIYSCLRTSWEREIWKRFCCVSEKYLSIPH